MELKKRTESERKAYIEGFERCGGSISDDKYKGITNIELFKREDEE